MTLNPHASTLLICSVCGRKYQRIKYAMRSCGAVVKGVTCGGDLKAQEKTHKPAEKP